MIWMQLICSTFIFFVLNMKHLLAQHIPVLGYTSPPSLWELPDGSTEPFFRGVVIPCMDSCLYSFLASVEAVYPVAHSAACRCVLSTNCK
jgi:hypothetical protein